MEAENNLKSIIEGVKKISSEISVVLTELVEEERSVNTERGECRARDEDVEDEDEDEDEDRDIETTAVKLKSRPPAKRLKTVTPS